jgi:archaemetzincin
MNLVHLLPVGKVDISLLHELRAAIPKSLRLVCEILPYELDPTPSYHPERQQYHSSEILQCMQPLVRPQDWRFLAIADVDLYIPILKYVFGEAQLGGPCAVVSVHRLRQEFYGLDRDDALLRQRLVKESIHEIGHTLGLRHCQDYSCVMASSHSVEWIDLRDSTLCDSCRSQVDSNPSMAEKHS